MKNFTASLCEQKNHERDIYIGVLTENYVTNQKIEQKSNENDEEKLIQPVLINIFHNYEPRVREKEMFRSNSPR